jgi:hypothetical protein
MFKGIAGIFKRIALTIGRLKTDVVRYRSVSINKTLGEAEYEEFID